MSDVLTAAVVIIAFSGMYIWGHVEGHQTMQVQAIEHGYALYCPTDDSVQHKGKFSWIGECDK